MPLTIGIAWREIEGGAGDARAAGHIVHETPRRLWRTSAGDCPEHQSYKCQSRERLPRREIALCTTIQSVLSIKVIPIHFLRCSSFARVNVMTQLVSHVLPPSSENACSNREESAVISVKPFRAKMVLPLNNS